MPQRQPLDGGAPSERLVEQVRDLDGGRLVGLAELALEIELRAYDLYRNAADLTGQSDLLTLAEQEKAHIRLLSRSWTEEASGVAG